MQILLFFHYTVCGTSGVTLSQYGLYYGMMHWVPGGNIHTLLMYLILSILSICAFTNITHRMCIKSYIQTVKCCNTGKKGFFYPRFPKFILKYFCYCMLKVNKQKLLFILRTSAVHNLCSAPQHHWHTQNTVSLRHNNNLSKR